MDVDRPKEEEYNFKHKEIELIGKKIGKNLTKPSKIDVQSSDDKKYQRLFVEPLERICINISMLKKSSTIFNSRYRCNGYSN